MKTHGMPFVPFHSYNIPKFKENILLFPTAQVRERKDVVTSSSRSPMSSKADVCLRRKDSSSARIPGNKLASALSASHWQTHKMQSQNTRSEYSHKMHTQAIFKSD